MVLSNGNQIPNLCFGTGIVYTYRSQGEVNIMRKARYWLSGMLKNRKRLRADIFFPLAVESAMKNGLHMFDTSRAYAGAEWILGKVLKKYNRNDYYIVSKLSNTDQYKGDVRGGLLKSLNELNMNYVDLYLMHWPVADVWLDNWKDMEKLYKEGLCKAIGVCNCNIHHLEELEKVAEIMPMVNEFECHPLFTQNELRTYCQNKGIQVMAYTATGRMDERMKKTVLTPIAGRYCKTMTQIILRWHQQIGNIPIVNSSNPAHVAENAHLDDFELTAEEVKLISSININSRLRYDPDNCDFGQL